MFLTHDAIARGVFNKHWSSGTGGLLAWSAELTNLEDNSLVPLWHSFALVDLSVVDCMYP